MTVLVALAANEPVVGILGFPGHGDIVARLGFKIAGVVPVASHVADKLEGIVVFLVVLRQVGSHLQRRVHGQVEGQRPGDGDACPRGVVAPGAELGLKDAWRVVHRSSLQSCEG